MAQRIEKAVHFEERAAIEFSTNQMPDVYQMAASTWITEVIIQNNIKFLDGFGGAARGWEGLDDRLTQCVDAGLPKCDDDFCRMDVTAETPDDNETTLMVGLSCGVISGENEKQVDEKAAKCAGHHEKCKDMIGSWLVETAVSINEAHKKIKVSQADIKNQEDKLKRLT